MWKKSGNLIVHLRDKHNDIVPDDDADISKKVNLILTVVYLLKSFLNTIIMLIFSRETLKLLILHEVINLILNIFKKDVT